MSRSPAWLFAIPLTAALAMGQTPTPTPAPPPAPTPAPAPALPQAIVTTDHPDPVMPGVLVTIDGTRSVGDDVSWDTEADDSVYRIDSAGRLLYFSSPLPGVYRFRLDAYAIASGKIKVSKAKATVTVIGAAPVPPPGPDPTPPPGPTPPIPAPVDPVAGKLHATLFYALGDTSTVSFRTSGKLKADLAKLDCVWYTIATTSPAAQAFSPVLAQMPSPVIVFQDDSGKVLKDRSVKPPKSTDDLVESVRAMRSGQPARSS